MKPKRQEDSSCVFAYFFSRHLPSPRYRKKRKRAEIASAQIRKKKFCKKPLRWHGTTAVKGEASSCPVCRSQSAVPVVRGIVYSQIRHRADHRTLAEPSAAEFSGLVSATALSEQGIFAPCGSVLTWYK